MHPCLFITYQSYYYVTVLQFLLVHTGTSVSLIVYPNCNSIILLDEKRYYLNVKLLVWGVETSRSLHEHRGNSTLLFIASDLYTYLGLVEVRSTTGAKKSVAVIGVITTA